MGNPRFGDKDSTVFCLLGLDLFVPVCFLGMDLLLYLSSWDENLFSVFFPWVGQYFLFGGVV